jgi:hypothetical protein
VWYENWHCATGGEGYSSFLLIFTHLKLIIQLHLIFTVAFIDFTVAFINLSAFWAKKQGLFDYVSGMVFENWKMVWYRYGSWQNGMVWYLDFVAIPYHGPA